jgi:hypothetical protein
MSTRRSGRAKAPVKYTSDSEGSDFGNKKPKRSAPKATPKKRSKTEQESAEPAASPKKRAKRDPETVAAEHASAMRTAQEKAAKQQHKAAWETWLDVHNVDGKLLDEEPSRDKSITQTDSLKKYGLKKEELGSLKHFEKRNPIHNNTMKLFLEEEVKILGFRKAGMLDGATPEAEVLKRGERIWKEEYACRKHMIYGVQANHHRHKNDVEEEAKEDDKADPKKKAPKSKTPKQKWSAYVEAHTISSPESLKEEPEEAINQSDCKTKYSLVPGDLAVLPYFPKPNQKYGNTTKLFRESEVKTLAYRKAAVLGEVKDEDEAAMLEKGKELFEEKK